MRGRASWALLAPAVLASCSVFSKPRASGPPQGSGAAPPSLFQAVSLGKRPSFLGLAREGDGFPALAVAVRVTAGPVAAESLAAVVGARLAKAGIAAETHVARDGFDVRVRLRDGSLDALLGAIRDALLTPVAEGSPEARLATARALALRATVADDEALAPIVTCRKELRLTPSEAKEGALVVTASSVEQVRVASVGDKTVAVGVVGPVAVVEDARRALEKQLEWPTTVLATAPFLTKRSEGAYVRAESGGSRISVAMQVPRRSRALRVAERAADPSSPLVARLRALPVPFVTRQIAATVHSSGACISLEADAQGVTGTAVGSAAVSAAAALVVEHELLAELAERADDDVAAAQIRALPDPREAAAAAANWALSADGAETSTFPAFAFGAGARGGGAKEEPAALVAAFTKALAEGEREWARSAVENRVALETNQGLFWLLLASPCPLRETAARAGLTALALDALASSGPHHGVNVEPWVAADGYGLLLHAARRPGESGEALAIRTADVGARLLALDPPSTVATLAARSALLPSLGESGREQQARLAGSLFPEASTALVPWGSAASVGRLSEVDVRTRWGGFAVGPLRAAVLANEDTAQATVALRAIDRWLPRTGRPRACATVDDVKMALDPLVYPHEPSKGAGPVFLVYPFDGSPPPARLSASFLTTMLSGAESPAAAALGDNVRVSASVEGRGATSVLVVQLAPTETLGDEAIAKARAAIADVGNDPLVSPRQAPAKARVVEQIDARRLSPRERAIALWRGEPRLALPADAELRAFAKTTLRDGAVRVVRPAGAVLAK